VRSSHAALGLSEETDAAVLDLKGLRRKVYRLAPTITLPPEVELIQMDPPRVAVEAVGS